METAQQKTEGLEFNIVVKGAFLSNRFGELWAIKPDRATQAVIRDFYQQNNLTLPDIEIPILTLSKSH